MKNIVKVQYPSIKNACIVMTKFVQNEFLIKKLKYVSKHQEFVSRDDQVDTK